MCRAPTRETKNRVVLPIGFDQHRTKVESYGETKIGESGYLRICVPMSMVGLLIGDNGFKSLASELLWPMSLTLMVTHTPQAGDNAIVVAKRLLLLSRVLWFTRYHLHIWKVFLFAWIHQQHEKT
jgi:hypothetical protein